MSSQIKDIKHIKQDFHYVALVMLQTWDLGVAWSQNFIFFEGGHVAYQTGEDDE